MSARTFLLIVCLEGFIFCMILSALLFFGVIPEWNQALAEEFNLDIFIASFCLGMPLAFMAIGEL